jgi:pSer/pThr/pTyr-binding forkhead associated (FHA) protein
MREAVWVAVILEIKAGPFAGKRVAVMGGQTVTVGRTTRANFAIPHDTFMSGVHFAVEYGPKGCILRDQKSSNGTLVNGVRTAEIALKNGDEVKSGGTIFAVRIVDDGTGPIPVMAQPPPIPVKAPAPPAGPPPQPLPWKQPDRVASPVASQTPPLQQVTPGVTPLPEPLPWKQPDRPVTPVPPSGRTQPLPPPVPARPSIPHPVAKQPANAGLKIGGWTFSVVPQDWKAEGEYGMQQDRADAFPSSAVVTEEALGGAATLQDFVEPQMSMFRQYLREPQIDATVPPKIRGAEEAVAVDVLFKTKDGQSMFYRRIYARAGRAVGVLTFTALQSDLAGARPAFDAIVSGAQFSPSSL